MNVYVRGLIAASGLTVLLLSFWFFYGADVATKPSENTLSALDRLETKGVSPFTLPYMAGQNYSSESLKGQIVVLNFWATWCPPCVAEFPSMIKLAEHYGGKVKLVTI
ncbi:MAG: TlpA disulfide reductase family protein, partial [Bdellovibrionia bacterium]